MVFLHGVGVAFWIGALAPLAAMAKRPDVSLLVILNRFSQLAVPVVAAIALTGLALAFVQLVNVRALIETSYGLILSIKLGLVTGLLGLAALNRFRLTPRLAIDPLDTHALVRSIVLECVVAAGILAVGRWVALDAASARVGDGRRQTAGDLHSHGCRHVSGADFSRQGR